MCENWKESLTKRPLFRLESYFLITSLTEREIHANGVTSCYQRINTDSNSCIISPFILYIASDFFVSHF